MRKLKGIHKYLAGVICFAASAFHLYTSVFGVFTPRLQRGFHLMFLLPIAFLLYPATRKSPQDRPSIFDYVLSILVFCPVIFVVLENQRLQERWELVSKVYSIEIILGIILIFCVIELIRRAVAPALAVTILVSLVYLFFGHYLPGTIGHNGVYLNRGIELLYLISDEGMIGMMTGISATYIAIFILFGAFLGNTGISEFFGDFTRAFAGASRGGPAKLAVISSCLFGTVSGSGVSNVFATGSFTIPLMKKLGYRKEFAGAVEAASSTGGQYMPPVMGAAAFIMAQMLSIPYIKICAYAAISAILYYFAIFYTVDLEAVKYGLKGEAKEDLPKKSTVLKKIYLFTPIVVLLYLLIQGYSPLFACSWCILFCVLIALSNTKIRKGFFKMVVESMVSGAENTAMIAAALTGVGIIVSVITHTAIGLKFASLIVFLSQGKLFLALILVAIGAIILGTGVPTTAAYILSVVLGGQALIDLGVYPVAAHLFCFYFAIISEVTPPVALCSYAGASLAGGDPVKTGYEAFKLSIAGFIVPFLFIYRSGLILHANVSDSIIDIIVTFFTIFLAVSVVQNYFLNGYLNNLGKLVLFITVILLVFTNSISDLLGILLFALFVLGRKMFFSRK